MPQKPSIGPLSMHLPTRDILCVMPASSSFALNCLLVYWYPRSLWKSGLAPGVCLHSHVEGIEDGLVVIAFADGEGNNAPALEVKDSAQIQLLTITIFHFGHVSKPLLIGLLSSEIPSRNIFCRNLGCGTPVSRSFGTNDRFQPHELCQPVKALVVVRGAVTFVVLVSQPTVAISAVVLGVYDCQSKHSLLSSVKPRFISSCRKAAYSFGNSSRMPAKWRGCEKIHRAQEHRFQPAE